MESISVERKKGYTGNWKNNVDEDLKRLIEKKGVIGAFLVSKNGDNITKNFQKTSLHRENTLMQFVKKVVPLILNMRAVPLRRVMFETTEGTIVFYNIDNGMVGCVVDRDFDLLSVMLEVRTVGDLVSSHLNNDEIGKEQRDSILKENRDEFRMLNSELLREIENHYGTKITEDLIQRTVR